MQKRTPKLVKVILGTISTLVGVIVVALTILSVVYTPEYIYRVLVWQESDVYDYAHNFPRRCIDAAAVPFYFEEAPNEAPIRTKFEKGSQIEDFDAYLEDSQTQALIVIQDGKVLYETYFNGTEHDTPVTSISVAKSFASTLIGLAIDDGYINSVNEPITTYLPELADRDPRFGDITIRHLLMMASGLEYEPNRAFLFNGDDPLTTYYTDQRQIALANTRIIDSPGEYFQYNKYHPQLLGMIREWATGKDVTT